MSQAISRKPTNRRATGKAQKPRVAGRKPRVAKQIDGEGLAPSVQRFLVSLETGAIALRDFLVAERRRVLPWVVMVFAVLGAVLLFRTLAGSQVMPLQRLEVVGEFKYLRVAEVVKAAKPHASKGFFAVDLREVSAAVEKLDWVVRVEVDRVWPDALRIRIVEQTAWALWQSPMGEKGLMNYDGNVFATGATAEKFRSQVDQEVVANAPVLVGSPDNGAELAVMYRRLLPQLGGALKSLEMTDSGDWQATVTHGEQTLELRLGEQPFDERLGRYMRLDKASGGPALNEVAYLDMRYPHGFAVGWREADVAGVQ